MLEIVKSNSETSNNSARLAAAALVISIARLAATAFIIPIAAASPKLAALAVLVVTAPLKRSACKVAGGCAASSAS
jgi:hypothetical protein